MHKAYMYVTSHISGQGYLNQGTKLLKCWRRLHCCGHLNTAIQMLLLECHQPGYYGYKYSTKL